MIHSASSHIILPVLYMIPEHKKCTFDPQTPFCITYEPNQLNLQFYWDICHIQIICKLVTGIHHTNTCF